METLVQYMLSWMFPLNFIAFAGAAGHIPLNHAEAGLVCVREVHVDHVITRLGVV